MPFSPNVKWGGAKVIDEVHVGDLHLQILFNTRSLRDDLGIDIFLGGTVHV